MSLRISNLRIPVEAGDAALHPQLAAAIGVPAGDLQSVRILRKSLDVRDKRHLQFVYNAEVRVPGDESSILKSALNRSTAQVDLFNEPPFEFPPHGSQQLKHRPVVIGSGPGGLVAAYFLALEGYCPLVLERGTRVTERIKDVKEFDDGGKFEAESNYLFGEGGAGTFSDGKLTCRGSGPDVHRILELFAECKGKPSILYEHRPHLGSNRLPAVVKAIRRRIIELGGDVRFNCKVDDIHLDGAELRGVTAAGEFIPADAIIVATGHSARDMYQLLYNRGVPLVRKPFQMGVRVEHRQDTVNRVQYGAKNYEDLLGNADYSLVAHGHKGDMFTFCMCAGGYVIPSVSEVGYFCTNGMSLSKRDSPYANSGLVVTVPIEEFGGDDPLAGIRLQMQYERKAYELGRGEYRCPTQRASDYLAGKVASGKIPSSYPRENISADLRDVLPPYVAAVVKECLPRMDRMWKGRFLKEAVLVGPESRGSSPVRIVRDDTTRESPGIDGLYPVGEGAGYAGGIVSAAVDGLRTAKVMIAKYAPMRS